MFINSSLSKIDTGIFFDNYEKIKQDYFNFKDSNLFFNYSHEYNLTDFSGKFPDEFFLSTTKNFPWKVCPIIFNRSSLSVIESKKSFTSELLLNQTIKPILATFSILEPGVKLDPHSDGDDRIDPRYLGSSVIKFHFSLDIPNDGECGLVVNNEKRILKDGDLNLFDEKLSQHYAYNFSENRRGVLISSYIRDEVL